MGNRVVSQTGAGYMLIYSKLRNLKSPKLSNNRSISGLDDYPERVYGKESERTISEKIVKRINDERSMLEKGSGVFHKESTRQTVRERNPEAANASTNDDDGNDAHEKNEKGEDYSENKIKGRKSLGTMKNTQKKRMLEEVEKEEKLSLNVENGSENPVNAGNSEEEDYQEKRKELKQKVNIILENLERKEKRKRRKSEKVIGGDSGNSDKRLLEAGTRGGDGSDDREVDVEHRGEENGGGREKGINDKTQEDGAQEERKLEEQGHNISEDKQKIGEEKKSQEMQKLEEERKKLEEEKKALEEEKRKLEEERKKLEEDKKREEDRREAEKKRKEEEEKKRKEEEERKRKEEEERKRKEEEERKRKEEEEKKRKEEEERKRKEEEEKKRKEEKGQENRKKVGEMKPEAQKTNPQATGDTKKNATKKEGIKEEEKQKEDERKKKEEEKKKKNSGDNGKKKQKIIPAELCISRKEQHKHWHAKLPGPSPELKKMMDEYEIFHRKCHEKIHLLPKMIENEDPNLPCKVLIWYANWDGMGNRILSLISSYFYAMLTKRVLYVARYFPYEEMFCEPFFNTTVLLPYSVNANLAWKKALLMEDAEKLMRFVDPKDNSSGGTFDKSSIPFSFRLQVSESLAKTFLCETELDFVERVPFVMVRSNQFFLPGFFLTKKYGETMKKLFPDGVAFTYLARNFLFPSDKIWEKISSFHANNFALADRVVTMQLRTFGDAWAPNKSENLLQCTHQHGILPNFTSGSYDSVDVNGKSKRRHHIACMVASLHPEFHDNLKKNYTDWLGNDGTIVTVHRAGQEKQQDSQVLRHNEVVVMEIWLLSFGDYLITSPGSTFGYIATGLAGKVPFHLNGLFHSHSLGKVFCKPSESPEPCFHWPPLRQACPFDKGFDIPWRMVPNLKQCSDFPRGLKVLWQLNSNSL